MKLAPIARNHLLQAAADLDNPDESMWSEYWILIPEKNKEYPFKQLVRKAYEYATGTEIAKDFFQSNDGYRQYIEKKFQYPISFRVRDNIPFFSADDLRVFSEIAGQRYWPEDREAKEMGERLRKTIFAKTNTWARALNLAGFEIKMDNSWQARGYFAKYSWARIYRPADKDKKIFFTVGVGAEDEALVYKLDCYFRSSNPENALTPIQEHVFNRIVKATGAAWQEIPAGELENYNWEMLLNDTRDFIHHYTSLYDEVIKAVWDNLEEVKQDKPGLTERAAPKGIGQLPAYVKPVGYDNAPDYDNENKEWKRTGDGGEALVIEWEKALLIKDGRADLAASVTKQPDWKGYDILSFFPNGDPRYIEVKTTTGASNRPFYLSRNEKRTMLEHAGRYCLYRLYNYDAELGTADFFKLEKDIPAAILEEAIQYLVYLK